MVTCTLTCGKVTCILDPPKHWPLGRDVHVNYLSEHVQRLTKVTPVQCDVVWRPLSNTHQSPGMPKECAIVTQCCNSSRNAHLLRKTYIIPQKLFWTVLLPFPVTAVSPYLEAC